MEVEDDKILLDSLGVTSANPDDIERGILAEVVCNADNVGQAGGSTEEGPSDKSEIIDPSSTEQARLVSKLRAVRFEIDAVASTFEKVRGARSDCDGNAERTEEEDNGSDVSPDDCTLHQALAADRLRSLKITKAQLEKEISQLQHDDTVECKDNENMLQYLVKELPRFKRKATETKSLRRDNEKRQRSVSFSDDTDFDTILDAASAGFVETERDKLVRKGLLTPFHSLKGYERRLQQPEKSAGHSVSGQKHESDDDAFDSITKAAKSLSDASKNRPSTKLLDPEDLPSVDPPTHPFQRLRVPLKAPRSAVSDAGKRKLTERNKKRPLPGQKYRKHVSHEDDEHFWQESENVIREEERLGDSDNKDGNPLPFVTLEGELKIPEDIFNKLFDYQKVGVQWLWELHCQRAGGIIGDEMGLGKTVQVLSFLGALHFSDMYKPSIIICPVTLLRQWKREAKNWYPKFKVEILHDSAQDFRSRKTRAKFSNSDCDSEDVSDSDYEETVSTRSSKKWDSLINQVVKSRSGLLITTYEQLRLLGEKLLDVEWGYAVLDEGHRIRNPNAEVTLVCKQLQTIHRIIMTGAPIQNKLTELWSLFDFVFPGKLGVLPVFEAEFSVPISVGGYANATPLQVSTAYRCAVMLRDLIMPYLLRRMKSDVNAYLTKKTEHVLFCSLTSEQRSIYRAFLASSDVEQIMDGNRNSLYGIDVMRKICNHPDLLEREHSCQNPDYGNPERSGKMKVVAQILKVWQEQGHRVLLFAQTQQMLDILENFLISSGYCYRRLDGSTAVKQRMALIDEFNNSSEVFVFIMTTKVGGLGTNLTGANRVIIFDPDWNPSTDMQARERAWRIGQKRDVTVYRLITRGTIEEKVYHRQIYKHFLTNKVLKNPQQKRFFKARDMKDLFTLNDDGEGGSTETSNIFSQLHEDINVLGSEREKSDKGKGKVRKGSATHSGDAAVVNDINSVSRFSVKKGKEKASHSDGEVDGEADGEANILRSLFDAHGIHSAVNHDAIVNAHDEEKMRVEDQASQVAQRAAEALRQSRMLRSRDSISVPTWTGKSGAAGAPSLVRQKFGYSVNSRLIKSSCESSSNKTSNHNGISAGASAGKALSSSELLARIRGNQQRAADAGLGQQLSLASIPGRTRLENSGGSSRASQNLSGVQPEILIRQICTFLQRGGSTDSSSIVHHFRDKIPPKDLPLFKNLLKEIATLEEGPNGKFWVLKPEFSNNVCLEINNSH